MTIGEKIKDFRTKKGLLQKDVAEGVGVSIVMISQYESDKKKPSRDTIIKLEDYFGANRGYLLEENTALTPKDKKDVAKSLEKIMFELQDKDNSPLCYGGEMSETDRDLLRSALGNALEILKIKNKEKYTPNKYRN